MTGITIDVRIPPELQEQFDNLLPGKVKKIILENGRELALLEWDDMVHIAKLAGLNPRESV